MPARVPAQTKELILDLADDAVRGGAAHIWACSLLGVSDDRAHRWRRRLRDTGALADRPPGGVALHALRPSEIEEILDICEQWGPVDRSHRKLAHRSFYQVTSARPVGARLAAAPGRQITVKAPEGHSRGKGQTRPAAGAGSIRAFLRICQTVDAARRWPSPASSPWMRR